MQKMSFYCWFVGNFRGKVPIECYIRLFQSYCSTHYGSILWPLHDRGFNDVCVTWNKGVRRMLNVSNITHTALLGQIIKTCHISIQLVKLFCKFVDLILTSLNAIVRHFVRRAIHSAQSPCIAISVSNCTFIVVRINDTHTHIILFTSRKKCAFYSKFFFQLTQTCALIVLPNRHACYPVLTSHTFWLP